MKKIVNGIQYIFLFIAIFSLLYFIFLSVKLGIFTVFNYFWLILTIISLSIFFVFKYAYESLLSLPKWLKYGIEIIVLIGCFIFILIEALIIHGNTYPKDVEADYVIILGAKVNGSRPSLILQYRIEAAFEYLSIHDHTKVIVSGGKGADEEVSEAYAMKTALISMGIDENRILMEDKSTNTVENLEYTLKLIDANSKVLITTSDFHCFRAVALAKNLGYENVYGNRAKSVWYLIPTNYAREFFAVVKDFLFNNL